MNARVDDTCMMRATSSVVITGLDPVIHALLRRGKDVDARIKSGHDDGE